MAIPAAGLWSAGGCLNAPSSTIPGVTKPNSKVRGVQIGLNVPYSFGGREMNAAEVLEKCVAWGVSGLELRTQPVEEFLGVRPELIARRAPGAVLVDAKAAKPQAEELREWRRSVSMRRVQEFRAKYESAGVLIEILKVDGIFAMSDDELDYEFAMAKALGARAISCEISSKAEDLKRLGRFADKHQLLVGYHGHTKTGPEDWEHAFALAKFNGANVDIGHFVAGNNYSPLEFIKKHHARIPHIHVKDKKLHEGPAVPFGEGDTPIIEILRCIRDNGWPIQATIEFEYKVPAGSDRMVEIARTIKYCREALA